jgi:hypothetical protein
MGEYYRVDELKDHRWTPVPEHFASEGGASAWATHGTFERCRVVKVSESIEVIASLDCRNPPRTGSSVVE